LLLQILALDLVGSDSTLVEKVRRKLSDKPSVPPPSLVESYQLNVKSAVSLYPCCIYQHSVVLLLGSCKIIDGWLAVIRSVLERVSVMKKMHTLKEV